MAQPGFYRLAYDFWRRSLPRYKRLEPGVRVLECGIGPGHLFRLLGRWFPAARCYGLDVDQQAIRRARQAGSPTHLLLVAAAEFLPFRDRSFDIVLALHLVEHLRRPELFLGEAARVLGPGGILALATPNPAGLGARIMGERWRSWRPEHVTLKSPEKWRQTLRSRGFSVLKDGTTGLSGVPVFRKFPLALLSWVPLFWFGFFPWQQGEAYVAIARKSGQPG
jgi:ubiquinone/menaquinone biosynthesis C-methylase UbiE